MTTTWRTVNRPRPRALALALVTAAALVTTACSGEAADATSTTTSPTAASQSASASPSETATSTPSPSAAYNVYAGTAPVKFSANVQGHRELVYVPNTLSNSVQVIDPKTYQIIDRFGTGKDPHHVVPSWDLKTLYVNDTQGNDLLPIDPVTGKAGPKIPVVDPYNLYFAPDGSKALVIAERFNRIDVADPVTFKLERSLAMPCGGPNHLDYNKDMSAFVISCEFTGHLIVVDKDVTEVKKVIDLSPIETPGATSPQEAWHSGKPQAGLRKGHSAMPQDVRLTPNGKFFLAADMLRNGVWVIDASTLEYVKFIQTGKGAHSVYPSRDTKQLYVANRDEGSVTVLDAETLDNVAKWIIPGGGSPDMGGVTADGSEFWLSGRYHAEVYVFDTATGELKHRIKTNAGSHGLLVWPQPGAFSLGHTGNMR